MAITKQDLLTAELQTLEESLDPIEQFIDSILIGKASNLTDSSIIITHIELEKYVRVRTGEYVTLDVWNSIPSRYPSFRVTPSAQTGHSFQFS